MMLFKTFKNELLEGKIIQNTDAGITGNLKNYKSL